MISITQIKKNDPVEDHKPEFLFF